MQIQTIEELSLNALPALQQILDDGWVLRLANGYTKRANSVTPLYPVAIESSLNYKIARCEKIYQSLDLPPIFRLTNTSQRSDLDRTLDGLGYIKQDYVSVRAKAIEDLPIFKGDCEVVIEEELTTEWLDSYVHAAEVPFQHWDTMSTMLEIIPHPTCYAMLKYRDRLCSCGLGVLERNYLGIFFFVTARQQRRRGYATQLISAMADWGKSNGATQVYLQVETANQAGINLYNKLGFTEIYQYFYRLKL